MIYLCKSFYVSIFLPFYLPLNVDLKSRIFAFNFLPFFLPIFFNQTQEKATLLIGFRRKLLL